MIAIALGSTSSRQRIYAVVMGCGLMIESPQRRFERVVQGTESGNEGEGR
jgi:hypothetical protein